MIYTLTLNPAIDRELTVPEIMLNQVLRSERNLDHVGGKGLNVSRMLALLGLPSLALGFAGGLNGQRLKKGLLDLDIAHEFIEVDDETRLNISVISRQGNKYLKVNEKGPFVTEEKKKELINKIESLVRHDDWWILSGNLPPGMPDNIYGEIISIIKSKGGKAVLDASGNPLELGCLEGPYLIKPNKQEAEELTGVKITKIEEARLAAGKLHSFNIPNVVISLDKQGALFSTDDKCWMAQAPSIKEINPIGAGDAMLAGVIWGLNESTDLTEALQWGIACGSVAAGCHGTDFGSMEEVSAMKKNISVREEMVNNQG